MGVAIPGPSRHGESVEDDMNAGVETLIGEHVAAIGDQRHLDAQRRRDVHARHALRYPASLTQGTYATTFLAHRPVAGDAVPCKVDLRKHGIEGGQGLYVNPFDTSGVELEEVGITHRFPLEPLDRASVLRLFGLAGTGHGDLVDDLGDALAAAWSTAGLVGEVDGADPVLTARTWEADRLDRSGRADLRALLPSRFAEAATPVSMPGVTEKVMFADHAINILARDEAFCDFAASLGGLSPLLLERPQAFDLSAFGTPSEFVREAMRAAFMPDGRAVSLAEARWLHRTFGGPPGLLVTEPLAAILVTYRRALGFPDLGEADRAALGELVALADPAEPNTSCRSLFGLMGDLGTPHGMPEAFLTGLERHRDATGEAVGPLVARLSTDARDLADAVWNAIGFQAARAVSDMREPGVIPMLLWDVRDPAAQAFMDGVRRHASAATYRGMGSEELLATTDRWLRAGRPGFEAGKLAGLGRRRRFKEIEFAKDKASAECEAVIAFLQESLGVDLGPAWMALARRVAAMGVETHDRWLRQDYPEPVSDEDLDAVASEDDGTALAGTGDHRAEGEPDAPANELPEQDPEPAVADEEAPAVPVSWWKRAATLGQALAAKKNA
jgi:hypothetical protein